MIDLRHPLAVLSTRLTWAQIETALAPLLQKAAREHEVPDRVDLFGPSGGAVIATGESRRTPAVTHPADVLTLVPEARLQPLRRRTLRALGRERRLAILQRHGLLRTAPALRRHPDRSLSRRPGRGRDGDDPQDNALTQGEEMAEAASGDRACHRPPQARQPHDSLPSARQLRRCAACDQLRGGL